MNLGGFPGLTSSFLNTYTTANANWQFLQANQLGQYLGNYLAPNIAAPSEPAEAPTNVDWLRKRVDEMRVRLA